MITTVFSPLTASKVSFDSEFLLHNQKLALNVKNYSCNHAQKKSVRTVNADALMLMTSELANDSAGGGGSLTSSPH